MWFYPYQSILQPTPTTFQISSYPELYECLNKPKIAVSKLASCVIYLKLVSLNLRVLFSDVPQDTRGQT